jgi:hypothetical protein
VVPLAIGCGSCTETGSRAERGHRPTTPPPSASESATPAPPEQPPPPPPELRAGIEPTRDGLVLSVQNRDTRMVKVRRGVRIERRSAEGFEALDSAFDLRERCERPAPECLPLIPGAELRPPAWDPSVGGVQCAEASAAKKGDPLPKGEYRMVITTCEHGLEIASPPFAWP